MSLKDFKTQYQCQPVEVSRKERELYDIAKYYHETCEVFDQLHCSGRSKDGTAMPASHEESGKINKHAQQVKKQCYTMGREKDLTQDDIRKAISKYHFDPRYGQLIIR